MRTRLASARESFWLLPTLLGGAAVLLGQGLVVLDRAIADSIPSIPFLSELSASGGRSIVTTIGTSMLTVAGTSFSITISVLATTSSTYGPRLVRNFMADRANQFVLAMFTSTFLFCLVVARTVRTPAEDRSAFVPVLGVHVAVLLAVVDVAVLVFFIHHIAMSVQITTLQKRVQQDLVRAVDLTHPASVGDGWTASPGAAPSWTATVLGRGDGYVQQVDLEALATIARRHDLELEVVTMPGAHVVAGDPLLRVARDGPDDADVPEAVAARCRAAFAVGVARTPVQDVRFALQQLVEVAVRGLAAGTNDPYTTVGALQLSRAALVPLVQRQEGPTARLDAEGRVRVRFAWPTAEAMVGSVLDSQRRYGLEHPEVVEAALDLAGHLGRAARSERLRRSIGVRVEDLLTAYEGTGPDEPDQRSVRSRGDAVLEQLDASAKG